MATSQNGYSVILQEDCKYYDNIVYGLNLPLRKGATGWVLAEFARRFNKRVENLGKTETFGYAYRRISGTDEWSNHASGTALDLNASKHPYGAVDTFNSAQVDVIRDLLDEFDYVIRWGGDYNSTKDEMHFEIDKSWIHVKRLQRKLKNRR